MLIDGAIAAAYVRFKLGLLQHMCRYITLGWRKGLSLIALGANFLESTERPSLRDKDGTWCSDSTALGRKHSSLDLIYISAGLLRNISQALLDFHIFSILEKSNGQ